MANLIVFRNGMIDASTIHYAECSSGLFIVSRKDGLSSVRLTPEQFVDLSEQIKRRYSTESTKSADQLQKDNDGLTKCLSDAHADLRVRNSTLQQERDAIVPKLEQTRVLISTIGAERDVLKADQVDQVELVKLYKRNDDLETCLRDADVRIRGLSLRNKELQQERDAIVPKLEHAMVLIATIGAERDALKAHNASQMAQNNALSDEIAELKKRIVQATEVISDLVSK